MQRSFWLQYSVSLYHRAMSWLMPRIISDEKAVIRYYKKHSGGRKLNLVNPKLFSEKLQWYKLNVRSRLMEQCANKYTVRDYIKSLGYEALLNELYGVYTDVKEIDFDKLPDRFVLKATHGSGWNIICKDKTKLNKWKTKRMCNSWLHQSLAWSGREWVYQNMPRQIIAERYLEDETGELRDYKFYCFNGRPSFVQVEVGRGTNHNTRNFYDMNWKLLPFGKELPYNPNIDVPRPVMFDEMSRVASDLCKPFQYVRVDLYQVANKVYFGELTFFPAGGAPDFVPAEYDAIVGEMWKLENK